MKKEKNLNNRGFTLIEVLAVIVILVIIVSGYVSPQILWNLTDYFIALLAIINVSSILRVNR